MNSLTRPWLTISCQLKTALNTRLYSSVSLFFQLTDLHRYKFQSSLGAYEDKVAVLSDADTIWTTVRHLHMRETIDKLMLDFNKFLEDNAVFKG